MPEAPRPDDARDARLREEGERMERMLAEVARVVGPQSWPRVEELIAAIVSLYGAGFERLVGYAQEAGAGESELFPRLCADELVSSLLLLHGLHPVPTVERVKKALEDVRPYLGSHAGDVELVSATAGGDLKLRLLGTCSGCPSSRATVEQLVARAIEDAAPEVRAIEVEGLAASERAEVELIELRRSRRSTFVPLDGVDLSPGTVSACSVDGRRVIVLRASGALLAYRNACGACGGDLAGAALDEGVLACPACGRRYDVARGGRAADGGHGSLVPLPLLVDERGARVAIPEAGA